MEPFGSLSELVSRLAGTPERVTRDGKEYLQVGARLLRPGRWCGSLGPLTYNAATICATAHEWNGKPITLDHPEDEDGNLTTANRASDVKIIGHLENCRCERGEGLVGDLLLDVTRTPRRIVESIEAGETFHVSTGALTCQNKSNPGVVQAIAPDHVALLPRGMRGALGRHATTNAERILSHECLEVLEGLRDAADMRRAHQKRKPALVANLNEVLEEPAIVF